MKTVDDLRRENLSFLAKESGGVVALSKKLDRSQAQVSQWLRGSKDSVSGKPRRLSSDSARYIEERCGKHHGWLDYDHISLISGVKDEESHENRKLFLQKIFVDYFNGNQAELARALKKPQEEVRQWLNGDKIITDAEVHYIELSLGLPIEWMNNSRVSSVSAPIQVFFNSRKQQLLDLFDSLPQSEQDELINTLEAKKQHYDKLLEELLTARKKNF